MTLTAFAPGRVNLIGEHTDYNDGLALPFAIGRGVTVRAGNGAATESPYVRGVMAELRVDPATPLAIESDLHEGGGLSSSAALTVAAALALGAPPGEPVSVARLCQRVERDFAGADTGLLDQLAILLGRAGYAVRIDFRSLEWRYVPLDLAGWRVALLESGTAHSNAESGYAARRAECRAAARALGVDSLRDAHRDDAIDLREPLGRRLRHVLSENERVDQAVAALAEGDLPAIGRLIDESHASLRDLYDASVPEVEATVERAKDAGATGARMMGGGFGGVVLALFPPGVDPPEGAVVVEPSDGARLRPPSRRASA